MILPGCRGSSGTGKSKSPAVLAAAAFAVGEFWSVAAGAAIAAVAVFVALRQLLRRDLLGPNK